MKKHFKFISAALIFTLALIILLDPYLCEEDHVSNGKGAPIDCCLQTCPAHHLAPTPQLYTEISRTPSFNSFLVTEFLFHSPLFADSIFHPPRA